MGLLTTNYEDNFDKSKKLSRQEGKKILKYTDKKTKAKLKEHLEELEDGDKSINQFSEEIQEKLGSKMKDKFLHAAEKHAGGGLTKKEKRRNLARRREDSQGNSGYVRSKTTFAGGNVESSHRVSMQDSEGEGGDSGAGFAQKPGKRSVSINSSSSKGTTMGSGKKGGSSAGKKGGGKKGSGNKPMGF